jgi:hypothetical protein
MDGGVGNDIETFKSYIDELKKDPNFSDITSISEGPDEKIKQLFKSQLGRDWSFIDPLDSEKDRFVEKVMSVGNGKVKYYTWKSSQSTAASASTYNFQECYNALTTYIDRVDQGELSNVDKLGTEKQ